MNKTLLTIIQILLYFLHLLQNLILDKFTIQMKLYILEIVYHLNKNILSSLFQIFIKDKLNHFILPIFINFLEDNH